MKFQDINARDDAEKVYIFCANLIKKLKDIAVPYLRRFQRFLFLPYCYFFLVDWNECKASRLKVLKDFFYIYFVLKDFPDHYFPCRFWEKERSSWSLYWGSNYNPWQRYKLSKEVQNPKYEIVYEDKQLCYDLCKAKGIAVPTQFGVIGSETSLPKTAEKIFSDNPEVDRLIIKPLDGKGGHGITVFERTSMPSPQYTTGIYQEKSIAKCAIQEFVTQEDSLSAFSHSLNTVRCVTLMSRSGAVKVIGAYMRFGGVGALVDNLSKGGMAVKIDLNSGVLGDFGTDRKGTKHFFHPGSKLKFSRFRVPYWHSIQGMAETVQTELPYYRLLGLDIGISTKGPVLIEVNAIYDNIDLEQVCGPLLNSCYVRKVFEEYHLFYNPKQRKLNK